MELMANPKVALDTNIKIVHAITSYKFYAEISPYPTVTIVVVAQ